MDSRKWLPVYCESMHWKKHSDILTGNNVYLQKKYTQKSAQKGARTNSVLSQHLIKSETAHTQINFKQSEGLAGADCSSHYSGLSDSLPCSPHLSAFYKGRPYGQSSEPPTTHPLLTPLLQHWPTKLSSGTVRIHTYSQPLQLETDLHTAFKGNVYFTQMWNRVLKHKSVKTQALFFFKSLIHK